MPSRKKNICPHMLSILTEEPGFPISSKEKEPEFFN
jgi:hypothetical protein